jgi:ribosomal protein S18 acetylase RimI-like enzyme
MRKSAARPFFFMTQTVALWWIRPKVFINRADRKQLRNLARLAEERAPSR